MDADRIIRSLAELEPPIDDERYQCLLCYVNMGALLDLNYGAVERHDPACPWRLAREYVAAGGQ